MRRYAPSISIIPETAKPGWFMLWVSYTVWDDDRCIKTFPMFNKRVQIETEPKDTKGSLRDFMTEAVDLAYQELSVYHAELDASIRETNARPGDTSVPS